MINYQEVLRFNTSFIKKMKYKKLKRNLELARAWWDKQSERFKAATTRPGGIGQRVITGNSK